MSDVDVETACVIRSAKQADVPAMAGLLAELFSIETEYRIDRAKQERGLRMAIERPTAAVWVADCGGQVVGMITAQTLVSTAEGGESVWIEDVVVRDGWRRRGIGRRLVRAVEQWCAARGVLRMQLLADYTNEAALAFYQRRGWTKTRMVVIRKMVEEGGGPGH